MALPKLTKLTYDSEGAQKHSKHTQGFWLFDGALAGGEGEGGLAFGGSVQPTSMP